MRTEINVSTGQVVELDDYPVIPPTPPTPQQAALAQILAIEQANPFTHRHLRDAFDALTTVIAQVNPAYDLTKVPGFQAVAAVETQISALRTQLK